MYEYSWYFVVFAFLGFSFNYLLNIGLFIINPFYISIGLLLGLPGNIIYDYFINKYEISLYKFIGILLVFISFIIININTGV